MILKEVDALQRNLRLMSWESFKKKRQIIDKLVAKEIKKNKVGSSVQKCTPKKGNNVELNCR